MTDDGEEWIEWGVIGRPHGVHGEMRAFPSGDDSPYEFEPGTIVRLSLDGSVETLGVTSFRGAGKFRILSLEGVESRESAQSWTHAKLALSADLREDLSGEDEFYADELTDALVVDESGTSLGVVREVANYGAGDILIYGHGRERLMVPFADPYIVEVRGTDSTEAGDPLTLVIRPDWIGE